MGDSIEQAPAPVVNEPTTPPSGVVEILDDGSAVVETVTTPQEDEEFYVQIQGSDRTYPAIVIRRKHRGKGATIQTISRSDLYGRLNPLYADYQEAISKYVEERKRRNYNTPDNTGNHGENATTRDAGEGSVEDVIERGLDKALRSSHARFDNTPEDKI